jgi:hypothetical protein
MFDIAGKMDFVLYFLKIYFRMGRSQVERTSEIYDDKGPQFLFVSIQKAEQKQKKAYYSVRLG